MIFRNKEHETKYLEICKKMKSVDCYRKTTAYLIACDSVCSEHIKDLYDFNENRIKLSGLNKGWQTGTSKKTTRLIFNLWNDWCYDDEEAEEPSRYYTPSEIFNSEYVEYYFQAIKIRFEWE